MLVNTMEYEGTGSAQGDAQEDAFYELLSSTGLASASARANASKKKNLTPEFDMGSYEVPSDFDFQTHTASLPSADKMATPGSRVEDIPMPQVSPTSAYASHSYGRQQPPAELAAPARHDREGVEAATIVAVEQTMKKYVDNVLHILESISGRISQLESTTNRLEQVVTDFKGGSEKIQGASGGKLLVIENMLLEVQRGVQDLRDRQEVMGAKSQLEKLTVVQERVPVEPLQESPRAPARSEAPPQQIGQAFHRHPNEQAPGPSPPYMMELVGPPQAPLPPQPVVLPAVHPEPRYQPPQQVPPTPHQHSQHPMFSYSQHQQEQAPPPPPPPHKQQGPPHPGPQHFNNQIGASQYGTLLQGPSQFSPEVPSYGPQVKVFPSGSQRPQRAPGGPQLYDLAGSSNPYQSQGHPVTPVYDQQMGGPPSYASPVHRAGQQMPSAPSGTGGYPRLPTAQPVQHALPTAREGVPASSGATPLSTNRLQVDEVVDKVAVMGFSKDQVRAVVRRLTENGQSVDLNIVLDKLMNPGPDGPSQKGWFSRG